MTDDRLKNFVQQALHPEQARRDAPSELEAQGFPMRSLPVDREVAEEAPGVEAIESSPAPAADDVAGEDPEVRRWYDGLAADEQAAVQANGEFAQDSYWTYLQSELGEGPAAEAAMRRWLSTADVDEDEAETDAEVISEAAAPTTRRQFVQRVLDGGDQTFGDEQWSPLEYLRWVATATDEQWAAACEAIGEDPKTYPRPGRDDLPRSLQTALTQQHFRQLGEDIAAGRKRWPE